MLSAARCLLLGVCCTLSAACCLLHVVCCMLSAACCLLHVAYRRDRAAAGTSVHSDVVRDLRAQYNMLQRSTSWRKTAQHVASLCCGCNNVKTFRASWCSSWPAYSAQDGAQHNQ
jgi:hypothetical protein